MDGELVKPELVDFIYFNIAVSLRVALGVAKWNVKDHYDVRRDSLYRFGNGSDNQANQASFIAKRMRIDVEPLHLPDIEHVQVGYAPLKL